MKYEIDLNVAVLEKLKEHAQFEGVSVYKIIKNILKEYYDVTQDEVDRKAAIARKEKERIEKKEREEEYKRYMESYSNINPPTSQ